MKPPGITPPLIALTNSKPSPPGRAARSRCGSRRTGRGRRSASCSGRAPWRLPLIVSRYGTRGGFSSTSTPKRSFIRPTITSTWICVRPATICSPVCSSRWRSIVGSSSWRRRSAVGDLLLVALRLRPRSRTPSRAPAAAAASDATLRRPRRARRPRASPSASPPRRCRRGRTRRRAPCPCPAA